MSGSVWGEGGAVLPTANADNTYLSQEFDINVAGTEILNITKFVYAPNTGSLDVYINGAHQASGTDYEELTTTTVRVPGLLIGDRVLIKGLVGSTGTTQAAEFASIAEQAAQEASDSAQEAELYSIAAGQYGNALFGTSVSSNDLVVGTKTFATQAGKQFTSGVWVTASTAADPTISISGPVTSYDMLTGVLQFTGAVPKGASGTYTNWNISVSGVAGPTGNPGAAGANTLKYIKKTAANSLAVGDLGSYVECAGTFIQGFDTPAALGDGWWSYVENAGTGKITIPASDGRTNWIMYPEEIRIFVSDGTTLVSKILREFDWSTLVTDPFVKPPGYSKFEGYLYTGGGAGSIKNAGSGGTNALGGAPGAFYKFQVDASLLANSELITIGAGGVRTGVVGSTPNPGGATSFGSVLTLNFDSTVTPYASNPYVKQSYAATVNGSINTLEMPGAGGSVRNSSGDLVAPGISKLAGNGGVARFGGGAAGDGTAPGGGGGATLNGTSSGSGAPGKFNIRGRT